MVTIIILIIAAITFGYVQRYPTDKLIGMGIAGIFGGFVLFGIQAAVAEQPKVPCVSEIQGPAQLLRAMPFACQTPAARR